MPSKDSCVLRGLVRLEREAVAVQRQSFRLSRRPGIGDHRDEGGVNTVGVRSVGCDSG